MSLPADKAIPTFVGKALEKIDEHMKDFKAKMLKSPMEISKLRREIAMDSTEPSANPNMISNMMELIACIGLWVMWR